MDVSSEELAAARRARVDLLYWFSNVFGERVESRNSVNPAVPVTLIRLATPEVPRP